MPQTNADLAGVALVEDAPSIGERLKRLFAPATKTEIERQIVGNGLPALQTVCAAMLEEGWANSHVDHVGTGVSLTVGLGADRTMVYRLKPRSRPLAVYTAMDAPEGRRRLTWVLAAQTDGDPRFRDLTGFSTDQIAGDVLTQLERWRHP